MQLTQKEMNLLKDLKSEEKLCVEKYSKHSSMAKDPQLKDLFTQIGNTEQYHYNSIEEIENGKVPYTKPGKATSDKVFEEKYGIGNTEEKQSDAYLCTDVLSTEKHTSSMYDTSVFEFAQQPLRDVLNHIQQEEQHHGKQIYDYMSKNNMC